MKAVDFYRFFVILSIAGLLAAALPANGKEAASAKPFGMGNIVTTCYALGGDASNKRAFEEAIYLTAGDVNQALATLKEIAFEGKKPSFSFKMQDPIEVIIFRGTFLTLGKVAIKKVSLNDSEIDVRAEYLDFPDCNTPSQPAAIIPVGKLPPGRYAVDLFVDNKMRKRIEFSVTP